MKVTERKEVVKELKTTEIKTDASRGGWVKLRREWDLAPIDKSLTVNE